MSGEQMCPDPFHEGAGDGERVNEGGSLAIRVLNLVLALLLAAALYVSASTADAPTGGYYGTVTNPTLVHPSFAGVGQHSRPMRAGERGTVRWGA